MKRSRLNIRLKQYHPTQTDRLDEPGISICNILARNQLSALYVASTAMFFLKVKGVSCVDSNVPVICARLSQQCYSQEIPSFQNKLLIPWMFGRLHYRKRLRERFTLKLYSVWQKTTLFQKIIRKQIAVYNINLS